MARQFVEIPGGKFKRVSNRFSGPGWDDTDPLATDRRRAERRRLNRELSTLCADCADDRDALPESICDDDPESDSYTTNGGTTTIIHTSGGGRLHLERATPGGMLTFASFRG